MRLFEQNCLQKTGTTHAWCNISRVNVKIPGEPQLVYSDEAERNSQWGLMGLSSFTNFPLAIVGNRLLFQVSNSKKAFWRFSDHHSRATFFKSIKQGINEQ